LPQVAVRKLLLATGGELDAALAERRNLKRERSTVTRPAGAANVISGAFEGRIVISCSASGGTHSSNDSEVTLSSARTEKAACARTQPSSKKPIASPKGTTRLCASMRAECGCPSTPAKNRSSWLTVH